METFLGLLAKDLLERELNFEELTVIFPNKRAGLFLAEELRRKAERALWMPEILTLDEFIDQYTGLRRIDETEAVIKLFKIFRDGDLQHLFADPLSLGDFYYWGKMLLGDFDDCDKYLVNAEDLFGNVDKYRAMDDKSLDYLEDEQREALRRFFDILVEKPSDEKESFADLWNNLFGIYTEFRKRLEEDGCAYAGMAQRRFCEEELWPEKRCIAFAGFNALNKCEKSIFTHYKVNGSALFYWDYDTFYVNNEKHEAGRFMRDNLKAFPNALGVEHFNNITTGGLDIHVIDTPSQVASAKLIPTLIGEKPGVETAVVLCDEGLLQAVRTSIPDTIKDINITMGVPARHSSVEALVAMLYTLRRNGAKEGKFYYKPVISILEHPLVRGVDRERCNEVIAEINKRNLFRVDAEKLTSINDTLGKIFSLERMSATDWLLAIFESLLRSDVAERSPFDGEILFQIYTYIRSLATILTREGLEDVAADDDKFYLSVILKLLSSLSIPFSGQPLQGMQLMGLLETRMLDFERLVILSANEGVMPKGGVAPSFIPYGFRRAFEMPTPEYRDAIFAYYFYRLLQRCKHADILYVSGKDDFAYSEMSRFLMQLKYEYDDKRIVWQSMANRLGSGAGKEFDLKKSDALVKRFSDKYLLSGSPHSEQIQQILADLEVRKNNSKISALSPSAISEYIECPRKFFMCHVMGFSEPDEVTDDMDARMLGNLFHEAAHLVYDYLSESVNGGMIEEGDIAKLLSDEERLNGFVNEAFMKEISEEKGLGALSESGQNDLVCGTVLLYIKNALRYDMKHSVPFSIKMLEQRVYMALDIGDGRVVAIGGVVDRVDETRDGLRIIDYKTGGDTSEFDSLHALFDIEGGKHTKAPFQTMLYGLAYLASLDRAKHSASGSEGASDSASGSGVASASALGSDSAFASGSGRRSISIGVYILRAMADENYECRFTNRNKVEEKGEEGSSKKTKSIVESFDEPLQQEFLGELRELIRGMLSPDCPIKAMWDEHRCKYCPFNTLCNS